MSYNLHYFTSNLLIFTSFQSISFSLKNKYLSHHFIERKQSFYLQKKPKKRAKGSTMQGQISLQVQSVVSQTGMLWQVKGNKSNKIIEKIIELDKGGHAIMLKNDCNKPLRFLYLCLLMSKKNSYNMSTLISKMHQISQKTEQIVFLGMSEAMQTAIGNNTSVLYRNLLQLHRKMQLNKFQQAWILKTVIEYENVDLLLLLILRTIADQYKMVNVLDCQATLTLGQVEILLNKFFVDKGAITNQRNKYVIFWNFDESEIKFLREKDILIQTEAENYQEISDPYPIKSENCLMIEKVYSLLDQKRR